MCIDKLSCDNISFILNKKQNQMFMAHAYMYLIINLIWFKILYRCENKGIAYMCLFRLFRIIS